MPRAPSLKPALLATRYVLYEDGTFAFQFSSPTNPSKEMAGRYKQTDGVVTFDFDPVSVVPEARGSIAEDSLTVDYDEVMEHSDFYDGVYRRER